MRRDGCDNDGLRGAGGCRADARRDEPGDRERLRSCLSEGGGAVHIGTDPDEWWSSAQVVETMGGGGPSGIQVVTDEVTVHLLGEDAAGLWDVAGSSPASASGR